MKPFNLEEALAGKPVKLRNGQKAVILCRVPDKYVFEDESPAAFPLYGLIFTAEDYIDSGDACWRDNGTYDSRPHRFDIIGMWEESFKLEDLPKSFQLKKGETYYYIHPHETNFYLDVHETTYSNCRFDEILSDTGNCFRTRKDAQKWIDFMKYQIEK